MKLRFKKEFKTFERLSCECGDSRFDLSWRDRFPCLDERTATTGFDRHYVFHTAWAARKLAALAPAGHVDVGSSLYFAVLISAFLPVRFYDYRPVELGLGGLISGRADLSRLPFDDDSVESLSCMHVIEHLGLGRYGDRLDPRGDLKGMAELQRVLKPGGSLLFVVPVGRQRIQFNAHRIYDAESLVDSFPACRLLEFALIPDEGPRGVVPHADFRDARRQSYGCGCFHFVKSSQ